MFKRTIPLLIAVAVVLSIPSVAKADHCVRCKFSIDTQWCNWGTLFGSVDCDDSTGTCITFGGACNHQLAVAPLSTEFEVASVERIDEAPAPNQALVAKLDVPQPAAESTR